MGKKFSAQERESEEERERKKITPLITATNWAPPFHALPSDQKNTIKCSYYICLAAGKSTHSARNNCHLLFSLGLGGKYHI